MVGVFKIEQKYWRLLSRRFWGTVFTLVIALAVCVQLGRQAFPLLKDYKYEISGYFAKKLGMIVELDSIDADWSGLRPKLMLKNVAIKSRDGKTVLKIDDAVTELSIINSVLDKRLSWRQLIFDGFETTFAQSEDGKWSIPGMPEFSRDSAESGRISFDDPYDIFIFGRRIKITQAKFSLKYYQGKNSSILVPNISIENDKDFHRILARLDLGEEQKAMSLVVEGHGDPRREGFIANGYFELNSFPTQNVIDALALSNIRAGSEGHLTNLKLWFRGDADKGTTLRGEISMHGNLDVAEGEHKLPNMVAAAIAGKAHREKGWQLSLNNLQAHWREVSSPSVNLAVYGNFRRIEGIRMQELDIKPWVDLALHVGLNNASAEKSLRAINPRGKLLDLDVALTDKERGYLAITTNVEKGESEAIMGAPAIRNLNGFLSMNLFGGSFDIAVKDGLTLDLPKVYHDPLYFEQAAGQLRWEVDLEKKLTHISSGLLTVTNPEEQGKGYLHLSLPFSKRYGEQMMTLALGVESTLAKNHKKYVPKTIPKHLYNWLDTSIRQGRVKNARFLYHGSLEKGALPTIQLSGEVYDGNLVFDPNWPELVGVTGRLTLENDSLDVRVDEASILGNSVYDVDISLVDDKTVQGRALSITGSLASDVNSAMVLLKNSPIKQHIGSTFDTWNVSGGVSAKVALLIPLNPQSEGLSQRIDVAFSKAQIEIPDLNLSIHDIGGKLHYHSDRGMFTDNLNGRVWDKPFTGTVESPLGVHGARDTVISFGGEVDVEDLYQWTMRPELKFSQGVSRVEGRLFIPGEASTRPLQLEAVSSLQGVAIDLPAPFQKPADQATSFSSRIRFYDSGEEYQFNLAEQLRLTLLSAANDSISAKIEINEFEERPDSYRPIAQTDGFEITGSLQYFDLEQWIKTKDRYVVYADAAGIAADPSNPLAVKYNFVIDKFLLGTFEIEDLAVTGERQAPFWLMEVDSELMAGTVIVPEDDRPLELRLDYLRIAGDDSAVAATENSGQSVLADIDLSRAVALDFSSREFSLAGTNYGAWDFELRPVQGGIIVHDIHAETKGMTIGGEESGAEFVWLKDEIQQSSQFSGVITAKNLADVFAAWGQEELLESESALIEIDAQWPGAPDQVNLETVKGLISLDVRKGSFARGAGSDENGLLRLIALFNFDTILRRLRLDFSDLTAQGYAYDRVRGNLDFRDGVIFLSDPLIVNSSSSDMQLAGTVDVVNEKLDGEMVITLPVASNIAVATAVVVGLPAALGVYVMSKLFKKQVDRASSLNVEVTGNWEDPKVKVKNIFDIDAANRRGKKIRENKVQGNLNTTAVP